MIRSVEEIKKDIDNLEAVPSCYGNEWKRPKRDRLQAELFRAITAGIPLDRLEQLCQAEKEGRCVVVDEGMALAMCAGAYAAEVHGRPIYCWDVLGNHKTVPYLEAARALRRIAVPVLTPAEAEAAQKREAE